MPKYRSNTKVFFETKVAPKFKFLKDQNSLFYFGLLLIVIGVLFYITSLLTHFWTVPYGGDYTQQQIPLYYNGYDDWHTFFRTGVFPLWDENTFLGADNIASNSFYYLFDPFFLPVLFFPRDAIPQVMAMLLIAKMVTAAFIFRAFLKYMGVRENSARLFAIAYGFVGWTSFYLWYNHFTEIAVIVPLVLFGIEMVLRKGNPFLLIPSLAILGITNYFFFVSCCFFGVMYALFRYFQTLKTRNLKQNLTFLGIGVFSFAVGIMISCFVVIPGLITAASSSRASSSTYLDELKVFIDNKDYLGLFNKVFFNWDSSSHQFRAFYPLASFFFPTTSNRYVTIFPTEGSWGDLNWASSLFIYTPMMICFFFSIINSYKNRKWSHFIAIGIGLIMLFTPFFYYFFFVFSYGYGRWQIFLVIPLLMYSAMGFDNKENLKRKDMIIASSIALIMMISTLIIAYSFTTNEAKTNPLREWNQEWGPIIFELVIFVIDAFLLCGLFKKEYLHKTMTVALIVEITVMGNMGQFFHGVISYNSIGGNINSVRAERAVYENIISKDTSYYRVQSRLNYQGNDNAQYFVGYNSAGTFHSLYNYNVTDFQRMSDIFTSYDTWIGNAKEKKFNFDTFLGVKYYITYDADTTYNMFNGITGEYERSVIVEPNVPYGYERIDNDDDGLRVFKNTNHISLGFSFDTLYYKGNKENTPYNSFYTGSRYASVRNEETYLKGAILNDEDLNEILEENPNIPFGVLHAPTTYDAKHINFNMYPYKSHKTKYYCSKHSFNPEKPLEYLNPTTCSITNNGKRPTVIELTSPDGLILDDPKGGYLALKYQLGSGGDKRIDADVILLDENDEIICMDNHTYPNAYTKGIRGLYSNRPVKTILIYPRSEAIDDDIHLFIESASMLDAKFERLNEYPLTNTWNKVNSYGFDTNFDSERMIVLQIPYDKGWKVKATNSNNETIDKKVYNAQGGFISFISEKGEASYTLTFSPYGFDIGFIVSIGGLSIFGSVIVGYCLYHSIEQKKKLAKEQLTSTINN